MARSGFWPVTNIEASAQAWKWMPCEAITPKIGMCLALDSSSGQLEISVTPKYICMVEYATSVAAGTLIPVIEITKHTVFEATTDGESALTPGVTRDVKSGGMQIDYDGTSNNNFLVEYASGTTVRGRFIS